MAHANEDKEQVRELYQRLKQEGYVPWLDEEDLLPGQKWRQEIPKAIKSSDFFITCLSMKSIAKTGYVQKEFRLALNYCAERLQDDIYLIPLKLTDCRIPDLRQEEYGLALRDYQWLDYYKSNGFERLIQSIESKRIKMENASPHKAMGSSTLATAIQKTTELGLSLLSAPFHRPFQYIGMSITQAAEAVGTQPNKVGNIIVESKRAEMLLEAEGNFISYVDVSLKETKPWSQNRPFNSDAISGVLSISLSELELVRKQIHFHTYYGHRRRLKIHVACHYEDAPLSVGFSSKYYGD